MSIHVRAEKFFLYIFWGFLLYYLYSITVCSAAPQTTLRGGPGARFEPGPGGPEAGTLPQDLLSRPTHLQVQNFQTFVIEYHRKIATLFKKCSAFEKELQILETTRTGVKNCSTRLAILLSYL